MQPDSELVFRIMVRPVWEPQTFAQTLAKFPGESTVCEKYWKDGEEDESD